VYTPKISPRNFAVAVVELLDFTASTTAILSLDRTLADMTPKVFISTPSKGNALRERAKERIFNELRKAGLDPRQMEKNEWSSEQPLKAIRKVIAECHGIVVLAFVQHVIPRTDAKVARQVVGDHPPGKEIKLPTVWNQIEATMAYTSDLPLLIIGEEGMEQEGLLEEYDWKVFPTTLNSKDFESEKFAGYLGSWKKLVFAHVESDARSTPKLDPSKITVGELVRQLTIPQFWSIASALITLLIAVATVGYKVGGGKWPWQ